MKILNLFNNTQGFKFQQNCISHSKRKFFIQSKKLFHSPQINYNVKINNKYSCKKFTLHNEIEEFKYFQLYHSFRALQSWRSYSSNGINISDNIVEDFKKKIMKANILTIKFDHKQVEFKFDTSTPAGQRIQVKELKKYIAPRFGISDPNKVFLTRSYDYLDNLNSKKSTNANNINTNEKESDIVGEELGEKLVLDDEDYLDSSDSQFPINMHLAVDMDIYYSFSGDYVGRVTFFLHELFNKKEISDVLKEEHKIDHQELRYYFHPYIGFWFWEYFGTSLNRYKVIACVNKGEPLTLIISKRKKKPRNLNYFVRFFVLIWLLYSYVL